MWTDEIETALRELEARRGAANDDAMRVAGEMIAGVRQRGDAFVREQVERFDKVTIDELIVKPREASIDPAMRDAIELAIERIEAFHRAQMPRDLRMTDAAGAFVEVIPTLGQHVPHTGL